MKTPDEIKKGLECCSTKKPCPSCPMWDECKEAASLKPLWDNALAYIQQLETERHQLLTRCERLERERDALLTDIRGRCSACKHKHVGLREEPCSTCIGRYKDHEMGAMFEWRGVKEE